MTTEEAIKILDPETSRDALWKYEEDSARLEACKEACKLGAATLRTRQDPPPNGPLTMEELREMDGQPVWFCKCHNGLCNWCVIDHTNETNIFFTDGTVRLMSSYGDGWMAYRRRPEEGT